MHLLLFHLKNVIIQIKVGFVELPHSKFLQIIFFGDVAARKMDVNTDFIIYLFLKWTIVNSRRRIVLYIMYTSPRSKRTEM